MRRGSIGRCDTYYDLLESHGRDWKLVAGG